jgi:hypothetical protein
LKIVVFEILVSFSDGGFPQGAKEDVNAVIAQDIKDYSVMVMILRKRVWITVVLLFVRPL